MPESSLSSPKASKPPTKLAALQDMGCDLVQGFHFARPTPAERIPGMLADIRHPRPGARDRARR